MAGEVASGLAVEVIQSFPFTGSDPEGEVLSAIHQAQERILDAAKNNEEYHGMGSTITLAVVSDPDEAGNAVLTVGHVGDSRCYVLSGDAWSSSPAITQSLLNSSVPRRLLRKRRAIILKSTSSPRS